MVETTTDAPKYIPEEATYALDATPDTDVVVVPHDTDATIPLTTDATATDPQPLEISDSSLPSPPRGRHIEVSFEQIDRILKEIEQEKL